MPREGRDKGKGRAGASTATVANGSTQSPVQMPQIVGHGTYKPPVGQRYRVPTTVFQDTTEEEGPMSERFPDADDWRDQFVFGTKVNDNAGRLGIKFDGDNRASYYDDRTNWRQCEFNDLGGDIENIADPQTPAALRRPAAPAGSRARTPAPSAMRSPYYALARRSRRQS